MTTEVHRDWRRRKPATRENEHYVATVSRQLRLIASLTVSPAGDAQLTLFVASPNPDGPRKAPRLFGQSPKALGTPRARAFLAAHPARLLRSRAAQVRQTLDAQVQAARQEAG